ncbi:MAG: uncharacterized protein PWP15_982 [Methanothermococcus sp.]|jgi:hypothetical protein|uniref:V4R domain-containing protein n=3 Tax=Methanothermococcus TaxID=155862 RepID=UPI00258B58F4|nr:V4R domain-containing protein [Methanothermococcus sp.]MDK2790475.1 uncharacterized protein [Methanothermococcus sp.]MDK2987615.1 uncharacterized protein [Methanothermococcus sp.]
MKRSNNLNISFEDMYNVNRPTLGRQADIVITRILKYALIDYLGFNSASKIYFAGRYVGENCNVKTMDEMKELFMELGIGILDVVDEDPLKIRVTECIGCSGLPNVGQSVCFFEAGIIAGCLNNILNEDVKVTETKCHAMGDDYCEFEVHDIQPSSDLN